MPRKARSASGTTKRTPFTTVCKQGDIVLAAITSKTSQAASEPNSLIVASQDLVDGSLPKQSVIKLTKLFTLHSGIIVKKLCSLRQEKKQEMLAAVRGFLS